MKSEVGLVRTWEQEHSLACKKIKPWGVVLPFTGRKRTPRNKIVIGSTKRSTLVGSSSPNEESGNLGSYPAWVTDSLGSPLLLWDSASVGSHHFTNCEINGLVCSRDARAWLYVGITWGTYKTKQNKKAQTRMAWPQPQRFWWHLCGVNPPALEALNCLPNNSNVEPPSLKITELRGL